MSGACIECAKEILRKSRASNPERTKAQSKKDRIKAMLNPENVKKKRAADVEYRKKSKEKRKATTRAWAAKNPEKVKLYAKRVKQAHKGKINFHTAKRRYAKLQRTPHWLTEDDHWMIEEAYSLAALRTKMFGVSWHVDHVIPLQGKNVSGLHVPINLQVIPGVENIRKGNRMVNHA